MAGNSEIPEGLQEHVIPKHQLPQAVVGANDNARVDRLEFPDKDDKRIEVQVEIQDAYNVRREIRDGFRRLFEGLKFMDGIFGIKYIPRKKAQEIADEERSRKKLLLLKEAKREFGVITQAVRDQITKALPAIIEYDELHQEGIAMRVQEYAKYQCERNHDLLQNGHYEKWRRAMFDPSLDLRSVRERDVFYEIVKIEAERAFTEALKSKDPEKIAEGFMELGGIALFEPEDLLDVPEEIMKNPEVKKVFVDLLRKFLSVHPVFYFSVRQHLVKLGFFENNQEIDQNPLIVKTAKEDVNWAFEQNPALSAQYVNTFRDEGFDLQFTEKEKAFYIEALLKRLREMAKESVVHYLALRKQFDLFGLLDADTSDNDQEVSKNLAGHLSQLGNSHPILVTKLMHYWRKIGLQVPVGADEDSSVKGTGKYPSASDWKNLDSTSIANRALSVREQEERNYSHVLSLCSGFSAERMSFDEGQLQRMQRKYPQYDPKNNGNAYMANVEKKE